jgi:dienelactone hydrolase
MKNVPDAKEDPAPRKDPLDPYRVSFTAETSEQVIATGSLELLVMLPDVVRTPWRAKGLAGTFFRPAGRGRWPGIIVVSGSGGGLLEARAALLASRGYAVLALAYFNYEKLPKNLVRIPLEYFGTALGWMQSQESVQSEQLAVMGGSRGGELALLLGATYSQIKAVVAIVPSHVGWGEFSTDPKDRAQPAWTYQGKPVPFMSASADPDLVKLAYIADSTVHTPGFALHLANAADVHQAAIPVERIQGPVLLVSGKMDKLWPSAYMADQVMKRLAEYKHPYPDKHLSYEDCGHIIGLPNVPVPPSRSKHPVSKLEMDLGGTPEASAFAAWDSWPRILEFLEKNLKRRE